MPLAAVRPRSRASGLSEYKTLQLTGPFLGFNSYQSPDTIPQGGGRSKVFQTPDSLNVYSYPFGSITSFPGHANINTTAANSSKAITGITFLGEISQKLFVAVQGKVGEESAGTWTDRTGGATITDDDDNLVDFAYLNSLLVMTFRKENAPLKWTGTGDVATLGGSPRSGVRHCVSWDGRMWLFSNQNADYSARNDPESYDLTDDTLNFLTTTGAGASDGTVITSATVVGDSIYVGKEGVNAVVGHLFRVYRTGNPALPYAFERIETGGMGPISQQATKAVGQDLIFLAKDGNVYLVRGNVFLPSGIGRNIQREVLDTYNKSRFEFASMGMLRERGLLGLALSTGSLTTNDRVWWYDYLNSVPGRQELEIWHNTNHVINAFGERISSGQRQLVTGGYDGFYERQLSGDTYAGSAYTKRYTLPWLLLGDYYQVYHILGVVVVFEPLGDYNVTLNYKVDFATSFTSAGTFNTLGGAVLGSFVLGTDTLGGAEQELAYVTLNAIARRLQLQFVNTSGGQPFNIHSIYLLVKPLYRNVNV